MDSLKKEHPVSLVCRLLQISKSGYYASKRREPGKQARLNQLLLRRLVYLHTRYPVLGLDSLYHILNRKYGVSRARVHRLMKRAGIHSLRHKAFKVTTNSNHKFPVAPNLLLRNFSVGLPNTVWVSDITYIRTGEGWLYLAIVKDLCTKQIVGYAFSPHIDAALTCAALDMAVRRHRPPKGLIHHSDRGVQYACSAYQQNLKAYGMICSMSRKGDPYDNAVAENFFSCLKCELVHLTHFKTRAQAQLSVFEYIEAFYNSFRPHSAIGWISPNQFALDFYLVAC